MRRAGKEMVSCIKRARGRRITSYAEHKTHKVFFLCDRSMNITCHEREDAVSSARVCFRAFSSLPRQEYSYEGETLPCGKDGPRSRSSRRMSLEEISRYEDVLLLLVCLREKCLYKGLRSGGMVETPGRHHGGTRRGDYSLPRRICPCVQLPRIYFSDTNVRFSRVCIFSFL